MNSQDSKADHRPCPKCGEPLIDNSDRQWVEFLCVGCEWGEGWRR